MYERVRRLRVTAFFVLLAVLVIVLLASVHTVGTTPHGPVLSVSQSTRLKTLSGVCDACAADG
jgi:hypothetical protein